MQTQTSSFTFAGHTLFRIGFDATTLQPADLLWLPHHAQLARFAPRRQAEHLAGRMAAVMALRHAGCRAQAPAIGSHREPLWPEGFTGSITHIAGVALAVAIKRDLPSQGVGIDTENVLDEAGAAEIAAGAIDETERRLLGRSPLPFPLAVTLAFCAKESLFKALFPKVGEWFGFDCAAVSAVTEDSLQLRLTRPLGPYAADASFSACWRREQNALITLVRL